MAPPEPLAVLYEQRVPLDPADLLEDLAAVTAYDAPLGAILDHICIRLDDISEFIDDIGPTMAGLAAVGESLAGTGMSGIMGMMTAGAPRAD